MDWRDYLKTNLVGRAIGSPAMGYPVGSAFAESQVAYQTPPSADSSRSMANNPGTLATVQAAADRSPTKRQLYVDHVAQGSKVKPTLRPILPQSKKNMDTFGRQEQRDRQKFVATGHKYWAQTSLPYHHHHKANNEGKPCPEDHVYPDKGRHKPEWCRSGSIFDPITSTLRPIGSPDRVELRPSSAPHARPRSAGAYDSNIRQELYIQRRPGTARDVQGRYNPLTHTWIEQPDAAAQAVRQKTADRIHGRIGIRTGNSPYSPNRGTGAAEVLHLDDIPGDISMQVADVSVQTSSNGGSRFASGSGANRLNGSYDGSRRCQSAPRAVRDHGETWGTYNCLHHKWVSPPSNKKYADREADHGISFDGSSPHTKKVPMPPNQGVYNPIT
eukprot:GHUV01026640.1.p1 GENE.GHUV01026640.1~~GHUV01026640.1.p1  ORF type:complete len:386 (+),score=87.54 GHUV01026640.1:569-1726(+)